MYKKLLILSLFITLLFVITAPVTPVYAGGKSVNVNWQIVGTIVQYIDVTSPLGGPAESKSLINLFAQGSPGPANITLLSMASFIPPPGWTFDCSQLTEYPTGPAYFVKNDFVAQAEITQKGPHTGEKVIRFMQDGKEYARAYECCWSRYYNCNRSRIGMYCSALDGVLN